MNEISKYYNSFSGTDTLAFMLLPDTPPITLGALTTISYSIYRDKKPVNVMGNINVKGFTRGTRVVAGTMIFTLINKHWIKDVMDNCPWLKNFNSLKADELPMFDIMVVSANEYGASASMFIYGVDITDESQTLSVEDLFTENQFSYVARDVDTFDSGTVGRKDVNFRSVKELTGYNDWSIMTDIGIKSNPTVGTQNIVDVQKKLQEAGYTISYASGVMDADTEKAIFDFQETHNLPSTGYLDTDTELKITQNEYEDLRPVISSDKNGSLVYKDATTESDIVLQLPYSTKIVVLSKNGEWYKTTQGYIHETNISIAEPESEVLPSYLTSIVPVGTIYINENNSSEPLYSITDFLTEFKLNIMVDENSSVLLEISNYYSEGRIANFKKSYTLLPSIGLEIKIMDFHNLFIYNSEMEEYPYMTEIFLQLMGKTYKWIVKYK